MAFWETVVATLFGAAIGGAGSIIAGILAVSRQLRGQAEQARLERRVERQEGALLAIHAFIAPAVKRLEWMLDHPAGAELPDPYAAVKEHLQHFYAGWETELSGKVYGDGLVDLVEEVFERRQRLEDECLKTHPIIATHALERCADFESSPRR